MVPTVIHFASYPNPFRVIEDQCRNIDCPCADVRFVLVEQPADSSVEAEPIKLTARVDPQTWQEKETPQRPPAHDALIAEFLRDFPVTEKERLAETARQKKVTARRLDEYRIDWKLLQTSALIPYHDVASVHRSVLSGGTSYSFAFKYEGCTYVIEDSYCPRPDCQCNEATLVFMQITPPTTAGGNLLADEAFFANLSFDGTINVTQAFTQTLDQATKVAKAWLAEDHEWLPTLKSRYDKIKEIARRSVRPMSERTSHPGRPISDWPIAQNISAARSPGRNDPCSCGSGKKYKRCCGGVVAESRRRKTSI